MRERDSEIGRQGEARQGKKSEREGERTKVRKRQIKRERIRGE